MDWVNNSHYHPQEELRKGNVFTSVCICLSMGGRCRHPPGQTPPGQTPPGRQRDGHCSGGYASYSNAFLFKFSAALITFRFWRMLPNNLHWISDHFWIPFQVEFPKYRRNGKTSSSNPLPNAVAIFSTAANHSCISTTSCFEAFSPQT